MSSNWPPTAVTASRPCSTAPAPFSIAPTMLVILLRRLSIRLRISSVALPVWLARFLTSLATTAKPLPASPARAASMVAFSASRLVCSAMLLIRSMISPILAAAPDSPWMADWACCASRVALCAAWLDRPCGRSRGSRRRAARPPRRRSGRCSTPLGCRCHRRGLTRGLFRGRRHRLRGRLHFQRRGAQRLGNRADVGFELVGDGGDHLLALAFALELQLLLLGLKPHPVGGVLLEHLDGGGHLADLVPETHCRHHDVDVAVGQPPHRRRHRRERPDDAAGDQHRGEADDNQDADDEGSGE